MSSAQGGDGTIAARRGTAGDSEGAPQRSEERIERGAGQHGTAGDSEGAPQRSEERPRASGVALAAFGITVAVALALDLLTKELALTHLSDGSTVRILGGAIYFDLTRNSGAAFSMGAGFTPVFSVIAITVIAVILALVRRLRSVPWGIALGFILGGAAGNLFDRLFRSPEPFYGHVVDFISVFAPAGKYFPIFNIADSALFCGVVLAILLEFTGRRRDGTIVRHERRSSAKDGSAKPGAGESGAGH